MKASKALETTQRTRVANLRILVAQYGNLAQLGRRLGYASRASVSLMFNGERPITERTARRIEERLGLAAGWMDEKHKEK